MQEMKATPKTRVRRKGVESLRGRVNPGRTPGVGILVLFIFSSVSYWMSLVPGNGMAN